MRIARSPDGTVTVDRRNVYPGRGAYVCSVPCLWGALGKNRLERTLRTRLSETDWQNLDDWANDEVIIGGDETEAVRPG